MNTHRSSAIALAAIIPTTLLVTLTGCAADKNEATPSRASSSPGPDVPPRPPAADFVDVIDNPLMAWRPGSTWVLESRTDEGTERIVIKVTGRTKVVDGVTTTVVRDTVRLDGTLIEDTWDWYAQDKDGNVWYFGEDTLEYDGDKVSAAGSWESGVDGAQAGIVMEADPKPGDTYHQEFYLGEAEDEARVLGTDGSATVPFGSFDHVLRTHDFTRLDPKADEHKYYARGVGLVLEVGLEDGQRTELVSFTRG